jgi:hypothetical protein
MGIPTTGISQTPGAGDLANFVAADALGSQIASTVYACPYGWFNFTVYGTFSGTVVLEKSYDGGTTWVGTHIPFTTSVVTTTAVASFQLFEPERGVLYRSNCTAYSSGTANTRISGNGQMAMSAGY